MHLPAALLLTSLTAPLAQDLTVVVAEGDPVPGIGNVVGITGISVDDRGRWVAEVETDHPDFTQKYAVIDASGVLLRQGMPVAHPPGAVLNSFSDVRIASTGDIISTCLLSNAPPAQFRAVFVSDRIQLLQNDPVQAAGVPPGTVYRQFNGLDVNRVGQILVGCRIDDPQLVGTCEDALIRFDVVGGTLVNGTVLYRRGDSLPDLGTISGINPPTDYFAFNDAGHVIFDVTGGGTNAVYLDEQQLIRVGQPSPFGGLPWYSPFTSRVDVNDSGEWAVFTQVLGPQGSDEVYVKNGAAYRQYGDVLPAFAPYQIDSFGFGHGRLADNGDMFWWGRWDDPDTTRNSAIFVNDEILVREGVTQVAGTFVDGVDWTFPMSPSGRYVVARVTLAGVGLAALLVDRSLGTTYCSPAVPNSSGSPATIEAIGSEVTAANALTLTARGLPENVFGYFLTSRTQGMVPQPGGSEGVLCLGGAIGRYTGPGQVQSSGASGHIALAPDLTRMPTPSGFVSAAPGESWSFQAWFRDSSGAGPTSNFTDGVQLDFR